MSKKPDVVDIKDDTVEEVPAVDTVASYIASANFEEVRADGTVSLSCTEDSLYVKNAPVSKAVLKEVEEYRSQYLENVTQRATDEAINIFKSDKNIDRVILTAPYTTSGRGSVNVSIDREKCIRLPGKGNDTITKPKITTIVNEPYNKVTKRSIYRYEQAISKALEGKK